LRASPQVPFDDMLFFDDLASNVRAARGLGISAVHVPPDGVCRAVLQRALAGFADRRRSQAFLGRWLAGPGASPPASVSPSARSARPLLESPAEADPPPEDSAAAAAKRRRT
jgi:hypothetical protein